jgi:quercetin dioxygenase-like cupin family protein
MQKNILKDIAFDGVKTNVLVANETGKQILISIEAGAELKEHISPTDASVLILKGEVMFKINQEEFCMSLMDMYAFKKNVKHAILASTNSIILLVR